MYIARTSFHTMRLQQSTNTFCSYFFSTPILSPLCFASTSFHHFVFARRNSLRHHGRKVYELPMGRESFFPVTGSEF